MSRPRTFDEGEVLDRALAVFRCKGFEGATLDELEAATGLGRGSLYCAFGDKRQLFLKALDRYLEAGARAELSTLRGEGAGREAIIAFFRSVARNALADRERRGCLVTNCAIELATDDPAVSACVCRQLDRFERSFTRAIEQAQVLGEIEPARDPVRLARFLVVCLQGVQVLARARPDPAWLDDLVNGVEEALR